MERRKFLQNAGLTGILAAGAAPAITQTAPTIKWRADLELPKSLDTIYGGAEVLSQRLNSMTGGKFQVQVFASGEIARADRLDVVQTVWSSAAIPVPTTASLARTRPSASARRFPSA